MEINHTEHEFRQTKEKRLVRHFAGYSSKEERNVSIQKALDDGYGQAEIGRYLGIMASAIAKVRDEYE